MNSQSAEACSIEFYGLKVSVYHIQANYPHQVYAAMAPMSYCSSTCLPFSQLDERMILELVRSPEHRDGIPACQQDHTHVARRDTRTSNVQYSAMAPNCGEQLSINRYHDNEAVHISEISRYPGSLLPSKFAFARCFPSPSIFPASSSPSGFLLSP
jgi:hypothetical protein